MEGYPKLIGRFMHACRKDTIRGVDLFVQSEHCEWVGLLERTGRSGGTGSGLNRPGGARAGA